MPVIYDAQQIPDRILYALLKSNLIASCEMPRIVPVNSFCGFRVLPADGFLVTGENLVIYETQVLVGRVVVAKYALAELVLLELQQNSGVDFIFNFCDGTQYRVETKLGIKEAENLKNSILPVVSN